MLDLRAVPVRAVHLIQTLPICQQEPDVDAAVGGTRKRRKKQDTLQVTRVEITFWATLRKAHLGAAEDLEVVAQKPRKKQRLDVEMAPLPDADDGAGVGLDEDEGEANALDLAAALGEVVVDEGCVLAGDHAAEDVESHLLDAEGFEDIPESDDDGEEKVTLETPGHEGGEEQEEQGVYDDPDSVRNPFVLRVTALS